MSDHTTQIDAADTLAASQAAITSMQRNGLLGGFVAEKVDTGTFTQGDSCYITEINAEDDFNVPGLEDALDTNFDEIVGAFVFNETGGTTLAVDTIGYFVPQGPVQMNTSTFTVGDFVWNDTASPGTYTTTPVVGNPPVAKVLIDAATGLLKYNCDGITRTGSYKQTFSVRIGSLATSDDRFLMVAPFGNCLITEVSLVSDTTTSGSSGGTEWEFMVTNLTAVQDLMTAALTTTTTEITADTTYDLGLDETVVNRTLAADDVLELQVVEDGSPTSLATAEILVVVEYQAI